MPLLARWPDQGFCRSAGVHEGLQAPG